MLSSDLSEIRLRKVVLLTYRIKLTLALIFSKSFVQNKKCIGNGLVPCGTPIATV